jgi:hypothetical protein
VSGVNCMEVSVQVFCTCTWVAVGTIIYTWVAGSTIVYVRGLQEGESRIYVGCSGHNRVCTWVAVR